MRKLNIKRFMTTRGCPYDCSYCQNYAMKDVYRGKGKYVRYRSVENVIEEIVDVKKKYGMRKLTFADDTFILDREWMGRFLPAYKREVRIPFACNVRANLVDEDLVRNLKDAGCFGIAIGVESGSEDIRMRVLNKHVTDRQIIDACRLFRKYGIKIKSFNMTCLPDETLKETWDTVNLNARIKPNMATFSMLQPYPGLSITNYAISKGYLPKNYDLDMMDEWGKSHSVIKSKDAKRMENLSALGPICMKHPHLIPLVRQLIKLPPNRLYKIVANMTWAYCTMRMFGLSLHEMVDFARKSGHRIQ